VSVIRGNISGSITTVPFTVPVKITSIALANDTAGALSVKLAVIASGVLIYVLITSVAANGSYLTDIELQLKPGDEISVVSAGAISYYLTIDE
jgi:hypothetical protein